MMSVPGLWLEKKEQEKLHNYIATGPERGVISKERTEFNQKCHRCQHTHIQSHKHTHTHSIKGGQASGWAAKMTPLRAGLERNFRNEPPIDASGKTQHMVRKRERETLGAETNNSWQHKMDLKCHTNEKFYLMPLVPTCTTVPAGALGLLLVEYIFQNIKSWYLLIN